jgi:hypothetical protein
VFCDLFGESRAHIVWVWSDAATVKIKTIGIPTSGNRWILVMSATRVPGASVVEDLEGLIAKLEKFASIQSGKGGTARAMFGVLPFVDATGVMKQGE